MKIKLLVARTGGQNRNDVIDVPSDEGNRMIDAEQAVLFRSAKSPEKAVKSSKFERAAK